MAMTISEIALDVIREDGRRERAGRCLERAVLAGSRALRGARARKASRRGRSVDRARTGPSREPRTRVLEAVMDKPGDLSDEELLVRLRGHVGKGNVWCAELIAYLVEVDERRLDRVHACSSLWDFCTRKLGMSEGEAHRRIVAARTVQRFPQVLGYIERGDVHLCALYAVRKHLTSDNVDELLREASGKSTREVEKMVAARFPRPDVPTSFEPVAPQAPLSPVSPVSSVSVVSPVSPVSVVAPPSDAARTWSLSLAAATAPVPRPRIEPLSATRYRVEVTVSAGTKDAIDRIKDLMLHRNPTGDLETILDASLALLLARLEKERLGKTPRPGGRRRKPAEAPNAHASSASAHVELATRAPSSPVQVEATTDDPALPVRTETRTHDLDGLARVEPTVGDPAAPVCSEGRTHDRGAGVHAALLCANERVSAPWPTTTEPSTAEPAGPGALPGVEFAAALRTTRPASSAPATKASRAGSRY
ncbi:MAG: hypothetical protein J0I07_09955, partial [Myxococcales bacterium]|nr:hypothetical protein [Myxococcales bacterium]